MKRTVSLSPSISTFAAIAAISGSAFAWAPGAPSQPFPQPPPTAPNHPIFVCPPGFSSCGTPVNPPNNTGNRGAPGGFGNISAGGGA